MGRLSEQPTAAAVPARPLAVVNARRRARRHRTRPVILIGADRATDRALGWTQSVPLNPVETNRVKATT